MYIYVENDVLLVMTDEDNGRTIRATQVRLRTNYVAP